MKHIFRIKNWLDLTLFLLVVFATQYVQQLRIESSVCAGLRSCRLFTEQQD